MTATTTDTNQTHAHETMLPADMPHSCLVVIPTYNEALNIERLLRKVLAQGAAFDVLVVDDASPDGTGDLVAAMADQNDRIQLLRRAGKQGLGTAYIAGFRYALQRGYRFVCEMDADFSHQPCYLQQMLALAADRYDVVLGSRNIRGGHAENWSLMRHIISKGGSLYARLVLGMPIHDCTGGYKCFRADALREVNIDEVQANGYAFQVEVNYRCFLAGLRICEIPIIFPDRVAGASKMSRSIVREAALMVLRLRFQSLFAHRRKSPLHLGTSHK